MLIKEKMGFFFENFFLKENSFWNNFETQKKFSGLKNEFLADVRNFLIIFLLETIFQK